LGTGKSFPYQLTFSIKKALPIIAEVMCEVVWFSSGLILTSRTDIVANREDLSRILLPLRIDAIQSTFSIKNDFPIQCSLVEVSPFPGLMS
jgi:hypothetical protein